MSDRLLTAPAAQPRLPRIRRMSTPADPSPIGRLARVAAWCGALALLGVAVYLAPTTVARLSIVALLGAIGLWVVWRRLDLGLAALLLATSSIIPRSRFTIAVPGAGLRMDLADMTAAALVAVLLIQLYQGRRLLTVARPARPIAALLLLFAAGAIVSAACARLYLKVNLGLVLGELRPMIYCTVCAFVAIAVVRRRQVNGLLVALFLVADVTALAVILGQFSASIRNALPAPPDGTWQINQVGAAGGFGSVRLVPPAHVLLYLMTNIGVCLLLGQLPGRRLRWLLVLQLLVLVAALILTYTRAQWIASLITIALVAVLAPRGARRRLWRALLIALPVLLLLVGLIGGGVLSIGGGGPFASIAARAGSIFKPSDTLGTASLQWRTYEDGAAIASIRAHPLLGVGLGNNYRQRTLLQGEASGWLYPLDGTSSLTRFAHNGYLYLAVKVGLPTFALFIGLCLTFLGCGLILYRRTPPSRQRLIVLACLCSFAGTLEWAFFEPHFMLAASMAALGVAIGIVMAAGVTATPAPRAVYRALTFGASR